MKKLGVLLILFFVNAVILDTLTTLVALANGAFETNGIAAILLSKTVVGFVVAKVLLSFAVIAVALWINTKNRTMAEKAAIAAVAFSFGVAFNNILVILGGIT